MGACDVPGVACRGVPQWVNVELPSGGSVRALLCTAHRARAAVMCAAFGFGYTPAG